MDIGDWDLLWEKVGEVQEWFPEGAVFIGGIAVYAHLTQSSTLSSFAAFSHDADMLLAQADFVDLRDLEEVVANRRLSKHQFKKDGFEFDVYVQNQNDLKVPFEEVFAASEWKMKIRVACPEHLLTLKGEALANRRGSSKGDKDEDDVFRILMTLAEREVMPERLIYMTDTELNALRNVVETRTALRIADGNAHTAKALKETADRGYKKCLDASHELTGGRDGPP